MKKKIYIMVVFFLMLSLSACGGEMVEGDTENTLKKDICVIERGSYKIEEDDTITDNNLIYRKEDYVFFSKCRGYLSTELINSTLADANKVIIFKEGEVVQEIEYKHEDVFFEIESSGEYCVALCDSNNGMVFVTEDIVIVKEEKDD